MFLLVCTMGFWQIFRHYALSVVQSWWIRWVSGLSDSMYQTRTVYGGVSLHVNLSFHLEVFVHGSGSPIIASGFSAALWSCGFQLHRS